MVNVQSAVGAPTDAQQEPVTERSGSARRPFTLCARHTERRREWINMQEGDAKREEHLRLFHTVTACPECQDLSWSGQAPPPPEPQPGAQPQPDTYSWWRDVMGQP